MTSHNPSTVLFQASCRMPLRFRMIHHVCGWISVLVILALGPAKHAVAQQKGAVAGTVTDSSGAVLKGAQVTVQSEGVLRSTVRQ